MKVLGQKIDAQNLPKDRVAISHRSSLRSNSSLRNPIRGGSFFAFLNNNNTKKMYPLFRFLLLIALCSACMTLTEKRDMQQELGTLQAQVEILKKRVEEDNADTTPDQRTFARLNSEFEELRETFNQIQSEIQSIKHFSDEDKSNFEKLLQDYDQRLQDLENQSSELLKKNQEEKVSESGGDQVLAQELYDEAISLLLIGKETKPTKKDYQKSEKLFKQLLKKHPQTGYKTNASYWLGEIYFNQSKFTKAFVEFKSAAENDPKHQKVPGARLKQGYCLLAMEKPDKAELFFQLLMNNYPKTPEAKLAQKKMQEIQEKKFPQPVDEGQTTDTPSPKVEPSSSPEKS